MRDALKELLEAARPFLPKPPETPPREGYVWLPEPEWTRFSQALAGAGEVLAAPRPKIVCICGSARFKDQIVEAYGRLTDEGKIVLSLGRFIPKEEQEHEPERKAALDA